MIRKILIPLIAIAALAVSASTSVWAQQQPSAPAATSDSEQVAQLKAELAKMKAEMDAMRSSVQSCQGMSPEQCRAMQQHMGNMQEDWQHMYDMCGMMGGGHMMMH